MTDLSWPHVIRGLAALFTTASHVNGSRPSALWVDSWLYDAYAGGLHTDQALERNKVLSDLGLENAMFGGVWIVRREG